MIDINDYLQYGLYLATKHPSIRHTTAKPAFIKLNFDEIQQLKFEGLQDTFLCCNLNNGESPSSNIKGDGNTEVFYGLYAVLTTVDDLNDKDAINQAYIDMKLVINDFVRRILYEPSDEWYCFIKRIQANSIKLTMVKNRDTGNRFGWSVSFELNDGIEQFDQSKWDE